MPQKKSKYYKKSIVLGDIFEKKDTSNLTFNALLYQNILEFIFEPKDEKKPGIRFSNLAKWLMKNNVEFREYYSGSKGHTPISSRIADRRRKIQNHINNLIRLRLMFEYRQTKSLTNNSQTMLYEYTIFGQILALLIRYDKVLDGDKKKQLTDSIIKKILQFYKQFNSDMGDFVIHVYENAIKLNLSQNIINSLLYIVKDEPKMIQNFVDVLNILFYGQMELKMNYVDFQKISVDTLKNLDEDSRKSILFHFKNTIESQIANNYPPQDWTKIWIDNIADCSIIVLYGKCLKCNAKHPIVLNHFTFIENKNKRYLIDCEKCNRTESMVVSFPHKFREY